jgi:Patatin-like phospholipase
MALSKLLGRIAGKGAGGDTNAGLLTCEVLLEEFKAIHLAKKSNDDPELKELDIELNKLKELKKECPKQTRDNPDGSKKNKVEEFCRKEDRLRKLDEKHQPVYFKHVHALKKHDKDPGLTALCLSGGGIRSAAFALGLMQGLANRGLLKQFDYLSTVSGGGYIGAWLTAWATREKRDFREIEEELGKFEEAPEPLKELRKYQAFLTPKVGISSPDTWAAIAIVIRNLLLNWLVFLPFFVSVLLIPRVLRWDLVWLEQASSNRWPRLFFCLAGLLFVAGGICYAMRQRSPGKWQIDDFDFGLWVVVPVMVGAYFLVAGTCLTELPSFWAPMLFAAVFFVILRIFSLVRIENVDQSQLRRELGAQFVGGLAVGLVIWTGLWLRFPAEHQVEFAKEKIADLDMVFGVPWFLMAFLLGQVVLAGLSGWVFQNFDHGDQGDRNREWWARASGWFGAAAVGWAGIAGTVIYGGLVLKSLQFYVLASITAGSGVISLLGASPISGALGNALKGNQLSVTRVITVASIVFIFCFSVWIAITTDAMLPPNGLVRAGVAVVLIILSIFAAHFVNVNYFSLNAMYRNRLVRTFLGASNIKAITEREPVRDRFDGVSPNDNLAMHKLRTGRPFHVINITLNVTETDNKAWQERKADSFISTPLHTGGNLVDYRPSEEYLGGITLGTAMSLSGAAVSPNWGYHSSSVTSFIMALFNVRLGQWLSNPRHSKYCSKDEPTNGWHLFIQEALGHTSADKPYIYVSDGGHFENLGLYEMIRRRCHTIVVSDAGADPDCTLEDLGRAIRRISIDFGVTIEFERIDVRKRGPDPANPGVYCAVGRVKYPEKGAREGRIVYIKPGLYDDVPADVRAYAAANAKFPHDITLNQWFTESQFESYRALGAHSIAMITGERDHSGNLLHAQPSSPAVEDLLDFSVRAEEYLEGYRNRANPRTQIRVVS